MANHKPKSKSPQAYVYKSFIGTSRRNISGPELDFVHDSSTPINFLDELIKLISIQSNWAMHSSKPCGKCHIFFKRMANICYILRTFRIEETSLVTNIAILLCVFIY